MREQGLTYDQIASPDMLVKNPALFYGFWLSCRQRYNAAAPHEGYDAVARWIDQCRDSREDAAPDGPSSRAFVVTSNVDGFMQRAGVSDGIVAQVHAAASATASAAGNAVARRIGSRRTSALHSRWLRRALRAGAG